MNSAAKIFAAAIVGLGLAACASHENHEDADGIKEIQEDNGEQSGAAAFAKLPQAAQDAVKQVVGNHEIGDVDTETDNGKTTYEVEYHIHKTEYSVSVTDSGDIVEREVEVDPSIVPPAVFDAAKKAHPDWKIGKEVDIVAADGKLCYEIDVKGGSTAYEMKINADGSVISDAADND